MIVNNESGCTYDEAVVLHVQLVLWLFPGKGKENHCPGSNPGLVMWDLWWTKWRWCRFSQSLSVFPAKLHSTNFSTITITYHPRLVQ
jgi:hypothetical protein